MTDETKKAIQECRAICLKIMNECKVSGNLGGAGCASFLSLAIEDKFPEAFEDL